MLEITKSQPKPQPNRSDLSITYSVQFGGDFKNVSGTGWLIYDDKIRRRGKAHKIARALRQDLNPGERVRVVKTVETVDLEL